MQLAIVVLFACGLALANGQCCSHGDAQKVIEQWSSIYHAADSGAKKVVIGSAIFGGLFEAAPGAKALFSDVGGGDFSSPAFRAQMTRVLSSLDLSIHSLQDAGLRASVIKHLHGQHAVREGVTAAAFDLMKSSILSVLPQILDQFNGDAWENCLGVITNGIAEGLP